MFMERGLVAGVSTEADLPVRGSQVPVLLLIFHRADLVRRQIEALRVLRPERLYVAADGPRAWVPEDRASCCKARSMVDLVDWPCTVFRLFRDQNLGLERGIPQAIDWFFQNEEEGAILEEDCVLGEGFLPYCAELLQRFRDCPLVYQISGTNFQPWRRSRASYFFSRYMHVWGWATWRRAWTHFRRDWNSLESFFDDADRAGFWESRRERLYWKKIYERTARGETVSWANRWQFSAWSDGALCVYPEVNLISNLGFRSDGTNTTNRDKLKAEKATMPIGTLQHPSMLVRNRVADHWTFERLYWGTPVQRFWRRIEKFTALTLAAVFRSRHSDSQGSVPTDAVEPA